MATSRQRTTADLLVDCLVAGGIDTIFGLPGDGINGIVEALRTRQDEVRFVVVRHEEAAAFMACAYAKWTGRPGCCLATTGPGGVHLLNGLYDAHFDRAPVVAITGLPYHDLQQTRTQQDIDHVLLFQDVADYSVAVTGAAQVEQAVAAACRTAMARRGVAHLAIAADVQEQPATSDEPSPRNRVTPTVQTGESHQVPSDDDLRQALDILRAGRRIAILAGQGARHATDELLRTSELLAAPVAKALLGKDVLPDDHANVMGGVGYLGDRPSQLALATCDTLLIVGSGFPYVEYYPPPEQVRTVQIDIDPVRIGLRYPVDAALTGDAGETLALLNGRLEGASDRGFLTQAQQWKAEWHEALRQGADRLDTPMKPQRVVRDLNDRLAPDAIVAVDCGHNTGLAARYVRIRTGQAFGVSGTLASMGNGLPYAIAAALAFPGRQVVAIVGDGGLAMSLAELSTCVRYRLPIKIVVINNSSYGQIKWEQMLFLGHPEYGCDLQPIDFARVAEGFGVAGFRLEDPRRSGDILDEALRHPGPALVDAIVDPNEPMLPPVRRDEYVEHLTEALAQGTPGRREIEQALSEEPSTTALKR